MAKSRRKPKTKPAQALKPRPVKSARALKPPPGTKTVKSKSTKTSKKKAAAKPPPPPPSVTASVVQSVDGLWAVDVLDTLEDMIVIRVNGRAVWLGKP